MTLALPRILRLPTTQVGIGILFTVIVGGLYVLYENWTRAGILFIAAGGAVALVAALRYPFYSLLGYVLFMTGGLDALIPGLVSIVLLGLGIGGIVLRKLYNGDFSLRLTGVCVTSILLTIWAYSTLIWAPELRKSPRDYLVITYLALACTLIVSESIRNPRQWRMVLVFLGLGIIFSAGSCIVSLINFFLTDLSSEGAGSLRKLADARFFGHWGGPNALAHTVQPFTALFVPYLNRSETRRMRIFSALVVFSGVLAVAMSLSRAAMIALAFALTIVFMVSQYRKTLFFSVTVALAVVVFILPVNFLGRVASIGSGRSDASFNERSFVVKSGLAVAIDHLPFGTGFGGFNYYSADYLERTAQVNHAHNSYIHMLADFGVIGLFLYLSVYLASLQGILRRGKSVKRFSTEDELRIALIASVVSVALAMLFEYDLGSSPHWFLFALAGIYPHVFGEPTAKARV